MPLHFNPRAQLWPSLAALAAFLLFIRLGFWQLDRAEEKLALQTSYQDRIDAVPVDLGQAVRQRGQVREMHWRRCVLGGSYDPQVIFLLDNQVFRGAAGYQVFSRFVLEDGASLLVDRGWVAAPGTRDETPLLRTPPGPVTLTGVAGPVPVAGIRLGADVPEDMGKGMVRVQRIDLAQLAAQNGWMLFPYIVRLDPAAPGMLTWNGYEPGFQRERHLGYAFQWFALATTVLVIYIVLGTKACRRRRAGA